MKVFVSLLILMSLLIPEAVAQTPGPPTNFRGIGGNRQFTLRWTHPSNVDLADIVGYESDRNFDTSAPSLDMDRTNDPKAFTANPYFTSPPVTNGNTFQYRIRARTKKGSTYYDGEWSTSVSVTLNMPAPTNFRATAEDEQVTLSWTAVPRLPSTHNNRDVTDYEYSRNGGAWTPIGSASTSHPVTGLTNGISYSFRVRSVRGTEPKGTSSRTVTVTPLGPAPRAPGTLNVKKVEDTAILTWSPLRSTVAGSITRYEYSADGGSTWTSVGTRTTYTVTGLEVRETYTFLVRGVYLDGETSGIISRPGHSSNAAVLSLRRRVIQDCPVGWIRSDGFAGRNRRALLYEVKVDMDIHNHVSIYKPVWVAIYVHPDEALENLDGWKLQVALPYNRHSEYLLTAENSVIVDAGFVEGGFAFIENPEATPFPMTGMGFPGSPAPGFDYRLYDDSGRRVDFGISCYKRFDIFQVLKNTEDPRVLRKVLLESFDWNSHYLRSEWTVATPAPAAPSLVKKSVVGTWADLKKQ
ncbi:MAG: fibronectin type III domain-containing protein [Candidatus Poribacteria bacterium]|nr:fibronectin type III domain-containing protein [Candidatus Poribacteria bacterium]